MERSRRAGSRKADAEKANRVMKAIMEMGKIDIAALNKAAISS
jgi:hypothetical protein